MFVQFQSFLLLALISLGLVSSQGISKIDYAADQIIHELRNQIILSSEIIDKRNEQKIRSKDDLYSNRMRLTKRQTVDDDKKPQLSLNDFELKRNPNQNKYMQNPYYQSQFGNPYSYQNPYNQYNQYNAYGGNQYPYQNNPFGFGDNGFNGYNNQPPIPYNPYENNPFGNQFNNPYNGYNGYNTPNGRVGQYQNDFFSRGTGKMKQKRSENWHSTHLNEWINTIDRTLKTFRSVVVDVLKRELLIHKEVDSFISHVSSSLKYAWKPFALHLESKMMKMMKTMSLYKRSSDHDLSHPKNRAFMRSKDFENQPLPVSNRKTKSISFKHMIIYMFLVPVIVYALDQLFNQPKTQ